MSSPDHNTINRFRGQRLPHSLQPIFTQVVLLLAEAGLLSIKDLYTDRTKIEANANRYTFVWAMQQRIALMRRAVLATAAFLPGFQM
jgi:transposase